MDQHTYALSVIDEHNFGRLKADIGFRYARTFDRDNSGHGFSIDGSNPSFNDSVADTWREPELRWALGISYQLNDFANLYSHLTFGTVDAPNGATTVDFDSPDRETRYMVDAGIKMEHKELGLLKIGGFYTYRDSAITLSGNTATNPDGTEYDLYVNRDIQQYGLELEARSARIANMFEVYSSATLMQSEHDDGNGYENYTEIPDFICNAGVYSEIGALDLNFYAKYVSWFENRRFAGDSNWHDLGNFWDLNLNVGYKFGEKQGSRVYCALENLLNDHYTTVVGYPDYGFQWFVGLTHQF